MSYASNMKKTEIISLLHVHLRRDCGIESFNGYMDNLWDHKAGSNTSNGY